MKSRKNKLLLLIGFFLFNISINSFAETAGAKVSENNCSVHNLHPKHKIHDQKKDDSENENTEENYKTDKQGTADVLIVVLVLAALLYFTITQK